jgi:hypothetical protein
MQKTRVSHPGFSYFIGFLLLASCFLLPASSQKPAASMVTTAP